MEKNKENILTKKYEVGRLLGKGTFAKVYYGKNLETGQGVAVKVTDKAEILKGRLMNQTKREISVMRMVKHPNILQLYEVMATKSKIYFVIEYAKGGELFHKVSKSRLNEDVARKYFQQLICTISFCHTRGVYHRDLKPENLLLDESGMLKVSDFGLSAVSESKRQDGLLHTTCGTPAYVAPEVISRKGYDGGKADIWSCGVILFVLLAGYLPFYDSNVVEMYKKISRAEYKFPNWFPYDVRRLISRILDPNPKTRISIARIMNHPWFRKGFDDSESNVPKASKCGCFDDSKRDLMNLNAFDIISMSSGIDLSGLFVSSDQKDEIKFTSTKSAQDIVLKFEEMSYFLSLKVTKKDVGLMRLERSNGGRDEDLMIDVSIFEIAASFHLVEVKKCNGDSYEYQRLMRRDLRPALRDIVWAWHGETKKICC